MADDEDPVERRFRLMAEQNGRPQPRGSGRRQPRPVAASSSTVVPDEKPQESAEVKDKGKKRAPSPSPLEPPGPSMPEQPRAAPKSSWSRALEDFLDALDLNNRKPQKLCLDVLGCCCGHGKMGECQCRVLDNMCEYDPDEEVSYMAYLLRTGVLSSDDPNYHETGFPSAAPVLQLDPFLPPTFVTGYEWTAARGVEYRWLNRFGETDPRDDTIGRTDFDPDAHVPQAEADWYTGSDPVPAEGEDSDSDDDDDDDTDSLLEESSPFPGGSAPSSAPPAPSSASSAAASASRVPLAGTPSGRRAAAAAQDNQSRRAPRPKPDPCPLPGTWNQGQRELAIKLFVQLLVLLFSQASDLVIIIFAPGKSTSELVATALEQLGTSHPDLRARTFHADLRYPHMYGESITMTKRHRHAMKMLHIAWRSLVAVFDSLRKSLPEIPILGFRRTLIAGTQYLYSTIYGLPYVGSVYYGVGRFVNGTVKRLRALYGVPGTTLVHGAPQRLPVALYFNHVFLAIAGFLPDASYEGLYGHVNIMPHWLERMKIPAPITQSGHKKGMKHHKTVFALYDKDKQGFVITGKGAEEFKGLEIRAYADAQYVR